jgi:bacillolysin
MKRTFIILLLGLTAFTAYPQQSKVEKELNHEGKISFLRFNEEKLKRPLSEAGRLLSDSLGISNGNSLLLRKTQVDDLGFTHQSYNQYYRGIKVEHGIYAVHAKNNRIEYISGTYKKVDNVSTTPKLSPEEALNKALKIINAKTYKWENPLEERLLKEITGKIDTTYYPKGELVIIEDILQSNSRYRLAYKFNIYAEMPLSRKIYYIDAINGSLLYTEQLIKHANAPGTAQTRYSGARTVTRSYLINRDFLQ